MKKAPATKKSAKKFLFKEFKLSKFAQYAILVLLLVGFFATQHAITKHYAPTAQVEGTHTSKDSSKKSDDSNSQNASDTSSDASTAGNTDSSNSATDDQVALAQVSKPAGVSSDSVVDNSGSTTPSTPSNPTDPSNPSGDDGNTGGTGTTTPPVNVAPSVAITAPVANATVSGMVTVSVNATDDKSVSLVSLVVDGVMGATSPNAPFSFAWDTTKLTDGTHTIAAIATDGDGASTTSSPVTVTVSNTPVTPPTDPGNPSDPTNLIPNPSVETSTDGTNPDGWQNYNDPANPSTFAYVSDAHTGSKSLQVTTSSHTTGGADWFYSDVAVTAGQTYKFTDWYKSNVDTELDAEVIVNGVAQYYWLGNVSASSDWSQAMATFTAPDGATAMSIYHVLANVGTLTTDDYSMTSYTPTPFNRAIVSVTFDDGWANQYDNAYPVMKNLGIQGTYYIISGEMTDPDEAGYMTSAQVLDLYQNGNEIGSHTVHHCDLTGAQTDDPDNCPLNISATQIQDELANSQAALEALTGAPVTDFAYPYGAYNTTTIAVAKQYYASQRTVTAGFNTKDSLDTTQLKMYEVDSNITVAQVEDWINQAIAEHAWLILTYHEVATTPSDPSDDLYTTQPADFQTEMNYLKSTGVATETVNQALTEVLGQ